MLGQWTAGTRAWQSWALLLWATACVTGHHSVAFALAGANGASSASAGAARRQLADAAQPAPAVPSAPSGFRSRCPGNCTAYGTCNEELGRCDCPRHRAGPDCSVRLPRLQLLRRCQHNGFKDVKECLSSEQRCLNGCNQRGTCVAGFCHCKPGHYGADCSLSLGPDGRPVLLAGSGYTTRAKRPWVYVYELPPELVSRFNLKRLDRPLHLLLWQRLLSAGARTADGDAADYWYIPVQQRSYTDSPLLAEAIMQVQSLHPWWNRTGGGHRHLVVQTGDWGRAEMSYGVQDMSANMTWLTHWGLTTNRRILHWEAAFRPDKDVVVPVYISPGHYVKFGVTHSPLHPALAARAKPRTAATFFFAGRMCLQARRPDNATWPGCGDKDDWYSGGVREKVHVAHWNRSGYHIVRSEPAYSTFLAGSTFCLAPPGAGHGQRQIQALFMGCVPVSIGDHVAEPFEPSLSWQGWGVRVAEADIPRLHELLDAITPEQLARKRSRMYCAAQHMLYSSITGSVLGEDGRYDAFETALEVLRVKAAHPAARPEQYRQLDPDFAAFMDCREPPGSARLNGTAAAGLVAVVGPGGAAAAGVERGGGLAAADGNSTGAGGLSQTSAAAAAAAAPPPPGPGGGAGAGASGAPALCSHARVDVHRHQRACYYLLRGSGYLGVPGGALCARGSHRHNLAACPRLWG